MNQLRTLVAQLGAKRLMIMGGVAAALLAVLAAVAMRGGDPSMGFLYTDLDPAAAQSISEKLKAENVPFELSADGSSIMAPQDKLAELRMSMAGEKLGGAIGYDVLDAEEPFGISSSRAKMNETRAIEGELARSIESLETVSRARVHIVMPDRAMFAAEARKATAAVTVKTKGRLPSESVQAIRHLVAASVPELSAESVSIVDQTGALLARAGEADGGGGSGDERQAAVEAKLRSEIESLLEPIVGAGKVRAEVSAQIDRDSTREESNVFDPDKQVIAKQVTVESNDRNVENGSGAQAATVAAQLPDADAQPATGGGETRNAARNETSEDVTYENSATRSVVVRGPGKINRLSVAVMVDGGPKGLPQPQVQRLTRLVENAVGIDAERGDSVVVESMAFAVDPNLADLESSWFSTVTTDQIFGFLKFLVIAVVGIVALKILKPKAGTGDPAQALLTAEPTELTALGRRAGDAGPEAPAEDTPLLDAEIQVAQVDGRLKLSAIKRIGDTIAASPPEAASVIRQWMNA